MSESIRSARESPVDERVGRRLGAYLLLDHVGRGGMGVVYQARHERLGRLVALKVLPPEQFPRRGALVRFEREIKAIGRLHHPNIVTAIDAGDANGTPYLVMELLDGLDLASLLHKRGRFGVADATEVVRQAALGLQHAHEAGLVHRDLKPSNLFLTRLGTVKILDLGLARIVQGSIDDRVTEDGMALGTFDYMAPEQWLDSRQVDIRADLYSLGCTLFALLTGRAPFQVPAGATFRAKMTAHLLEPPPDLERTCPDAPKVLAQLVARLLAKDPGDRFPDPSSLAVAIEPFAEGASLATLFEEPSSPSERVEAVILKPAEEAPEQVIDEDVQFTVYRPRAVAPLRWATMIVFAHRSTDRPDSSTDSLGSAEEVARQARHLLGPTVARDFQATTQDATTGLPREETVTLVPSIDGVEFNPERGRFRWTETIHREEFRLRASEALDGKVARGRLSVFLGSILLAEVTLSIKVDRAHVIDADAPTEKATAARFRQLYASYAKEDHAIARQFERYARAVGDTFLSRSLAMRTGDQTADRVREAIHSADIFQLFWSRNALRSKSVEHEWRYALSLGRSQFIRPVYWENPFPSDPERGLPPAELRLYHFTRLFTYNLDVKSDGNQERVADAHAGGGVGDPDIRLAVPDPKAPSDSDVTLIADDTSQHDLLVSGSGSGSSSGDTAVRPSPLPGSSAEVSAQADSDSDFELTPSSVIDALQPDSGSDFELNALDGSDGKGRKDIFDDPDFEVDALDELGDESNDRTMQLDAASDFEIEESDSGSEVFAVDEDDIDQNRGTVAASSPLLDDDDEDEDDDEFNDCAEEDEDQQDSSTQITVMGKCPGTREIRVSLLVIALVIIWLLFLGYFLTLP